MSRNTKIILIIVAAALVLLCLCAATSAFLATVFFRNISVTASPVQIETAAGEAVLVEPRQAEFAANDIADFTLPEGWVSDYSMKVAGFRLVGYKPAGGAGHLIFAVIPETASTNIDQVERAIRSLADTHGYQWNRADMTVVERKPVTVHGESSEMVVSEGSGSSGAWRQAMTTFRGNQGLTLVIYGMPQVAYDQGDVDALFASIQ